MSDWIEGTTATIRALAQSLDAAMGYPRPPGRVIGRVSRPIPQTWDGTGAVPFGWAVSRLNLRRVSAGRVALQVTDEVRDVAQLAGISLPPTQQRDESYLRDARAVDPIEDRPPPAPGPTLDEAFRARWPDLPLVARADPARGQPGGRR